MAFDRNNELGGLWLKESKGGQRYMSGRLTLPNGESVEIVVFKNAHKQPGERTPDYRVYRSEPRDGGATQGERPDAPEKMVDPRQAQAAVEAQRPSRPPPTMGDVRRAYGLPDDGKARKPIDYNAPLNDEIPF